MTRFLFVLAALPLTLGVCNGQSKLESKLAKPERYVEIPVTSEVNSEQISKSGVPFMLPAAPQPGSRIINVALDGRAKRLFLLGMTETAYVHAWADPRDQSVRFFIGDNLGDLLIRYADGSMQDFPLVLGESVWWGKSFYGYPYPFPDDPHFRTALAESLRLYRPEPMQDGRYIAVITPRAARISTITITSSPNKIGSVGIDAITAEASVDSGFPLGHSVPLQRLDSSLKAFADRHSLRSSGQGEAIAQQRLLKLARSLYTSDEDFRQPVKAMIPDGYEGPRVLFKGDVYASILTNAFYANVSDMLSKIDADGMYHTSSKGAVSWNGTGFGTYKPDVGMYYATSWSRDMGRTLHELTELGYTPPALRCAQFCFRTAQLWTEDPKLLFRGEQLPAHWGRVANRPNPNTAFENDGHGLISIYLYSLWQHLPNRREWLLANWDGVEAAGDWIVWQFAHPQISGAENGLLGTNGESAGGPRGHTVFADYICMDALRGLAEMADSIGHSDSARIWRARADEMHDAMPKGYIIDDPEYGKVWTLKSAGWPDKSTVLGPLIFLADFTGFAPEDDDKAWRPVNEAAYQRLLNTYKPFGFYGQAMGYGQGFVTESALLLDRMQDATNFLKWTAKQIYDPKYGSFVVPEGVQVSPDAQFWYRAGDLGNGVQEAEIIKTLRLVIGVDDTHPDRLRIFPRLPNDWHEIAVQDYPILAEQDGAPSMAHVTYTLRRTGTTMNFRVTSDRMLGKIAVRLGPFAAKPGNSSVTINGERPVDASYERSGDSWWVRATAVVEPAPRFF